MMPLMKTNALCQQSRLLAEQCRLELMKLHEKQTEAEVYIETARTYLETANWSPPSQSHELHAGTAPSLPTVRGADASWNKRAQETRFLAERIKDACAKREMMEIAEQYDRLGVAGPASNPSPAVHVPSASSAIAA
jgi:hypothetical protein